MVTFTACRSKPEVVVPARATPQEVKQLSDVDNQRDLRLYVTFIEFYRRRVVGVPEPSAASSTIKAALAECQGAGVLLPCCRPPAGAPWRRQTGAELHGGRRGVRGGAR
ncbi:hypothetical protein QYE76_038090 [Lolium multiflorum]|uniref:Uncharacterized protein n=1 Tax=Lolium multiflorum TaxID=4521 RepID=A0AAD8T8E9_LOLMU|nr:hypothetical protein QYE76_038090 [Lolium multiflorum]